MGACVGDVTFFNHVGQLGPCVGDVTFFNHVGQLGPHVDDVTSTHEKPTKNMKNWFAWFFKVVSWFIKVLGWFSCFSKVVSWVFHGFCLVLPIAMCATSPYLVTLRPELALMSNIRANLSS